MRCLIWTIKCIFWITIWAFATYGACQLQYRSDRIAEAQTQRTKITELSAEIGKLKAGNEFVTFLVEQFPSLIPTKAQLHEISFLIYAAEQSKKNNYFVPKHRHNKPDGSRN